MTYSSVLSQHFIIQQTDNWYVLDEDFMFDLAWLKSEVERCMNKSFSIPVVFCDSCEANKIVSELGYEECEFLLYAAGVYWREVNMVFIFSFDDLRTTIETLFHELRHVEQEGIEELKKCFDTDKKLPYEERVTEKDAFAFAKDKLHTFITTNPQYDHLF